MDVVGAHSGIFYHVQGSPEVTRINVRERRGDLYVRIDLAIPTSPSREERGLYRRLRDLQRKRDRSEP